MTDHASPQDSDEAQKATHPEDHAVLQVDIYGAKLKTPLRTRPVEEDDPETWSAVWPSINKSLIAFVVHLFGSLPDSAKAYRSFARGIGNLPDAIGKRISGAHQRADEQEAQRQASAIDGPPLAVAAAHESLEVIVSRLQANGNVVTFTQDPSGAWIIGVTRPELKEHAQGAAAQLMLESSQPSLPQTVDSSGIEFFNGVTFEEIVDKDVDVFLKADGPTGDKVELCRTFDRDGRIWIDLIPDLNRKYVIPVPSDAIISRNDADLSHGRFGVFISPTSEQGQFVRSLIDAKKEQMRS